MRRLYNLEKKQFLASPDSNFLENIRKNFFSQRYIHHNPLNSHFDMVSLPTGAINRSTAKAQRKNLVVLISIDPPISSPPISVEAPPIVVETENFFEKTEFLKNEQNH